MLRNSFRTTSNILRILSEPFRLSLKHSQIIPMIRTKIYNAINTLSVLPSGREHTDMDETPLRPMIIRGTWMPIMTPVHSTK